MPLLLTFVLEGCGGDCEFNRVQASLEWRIVETDERGLTIGSVGSGNVFDYEAIERAVVRPETATGQLAGMMDAPREGRLLLATFALPFPLAVGDVIVGSGHGGGGWGLLPDRTLDNGVRVVFGPAPPGEAPLRSTMQRLEVVAVAPLRLLLSWVHQSAGQTTSLSGTITLSRSITHGVCD
jgi:hypothetical protein